MLDIYSAFCYANFMKRSEGKYNRKHSALQKVIFLLIFVGILSLTYYFNTNHKNSQIAGKKANPATENKISVEDQKTLDCSKKIATGKDLLAQNTTSSDCFFMGCGDFFQ